MGFWQRWFSRSNHESPTTSLSDPDDWLWDALGARRSATGASVTPENSLSVSAVWAAVRMISSTLATLPLHTYRHTAEGRERDRAHPVDSLLSFRPNPEQSGYVFRELLAAHLLLFGDAFAEIERNGKDEPIALWPLYPTAVSVRRLDNGSKVYLVTVQGQEVPLTAENVLHVQGFGLDGLRGLSAVHMGREAVGIAKATEQFGASFFGNGAMPLGAITVPGNLMKEQETKLREAWDRQHKGLTNAQRLAFLSGGMTYQALGIAPEHAQFLETRKFQVGEISRLFGIPPHLIGDLERATFSNIEAQGIEFVRYCIEPLTRRFESEYNTKLFGDRSQYAEHTLEGLLRGDSAARAAWYTAMINAGVYSVNEVRERENLNRIPEGDTRRVPLNMGELGKEANSNA